MDFRSSFRLSGWLFAAAALGLLSSAQAATLGVPLQSLGIPATDLIHQGQPIDRDQAANLHRSGTDLSTLEPTPSDAWSPQALPPVSTEEWNYPADGGTVRFDSNMDATERVMRARVISGERPFQLLASLRAHTAMTTAALLRSLGYPIASPKRYTSLTVQFPTVESRDEFLNNLADRNQACRGRWLKYEPQNSAEAEQIKKDPCAKADLVKLGTNPEVTLQDIVLEPGQIDTWMFHWGIMKAPLLKGRRALRALVVPVVLADIQESINLYSWEMAKILSNTLILTHPYADQYQEASFTDIKWIARKIAHLTRSQITQIVKAGEYPADVEALLVEKMISRQKQLAGLFGIQPDGVSFQFNPKISVGGVKEGKLLTEWYPTYSMRFAYEDPETPLRTDEIAKFFQIEGLSAGLGKLIEGVNKNLQFLTTQDAAIAHQKDLQNAAIKCLQGGGSPAECFAQPVGVWGGPIAGVGVQADRSVITGSYYGGESRVQLVDNVGVTASVGLFVTKDGLPKIEGVPISAAVFSNMSFTRNFVHVRPLTSMSQATRDNWGNIYVPKFMDRLAQKLSVELSDDPEIKKPEQFFEDLKEGEMFIVTDSVGVGAQASVTLPLTGLLDVGIMGVNPSLSIGAGTQRAILRRTTIMRTKDGLQVYLQRINTSAFHFSVDINFWMKVFTYTQTTKKGYAQSKAFLIKGEIEAERRKPLATALRALLKSNNAEILEGEFGHYALDHSMNSKVEQGRFLRWQWYGLDESHKVKIRPPAPHNTPEKERTLFSHRIVRTNGSNDAALFNDVISKYAPGWQVLPTAGANPANSFLGRGQWAVWSGEAELTPWHPSGIVTSVEHHWAGWKLGKDAFFKILDGIEAKVKPLNLDQPIIRREEFMTMRELQLYEITSKLLIYESGMKKLMESILDANSDNATVHKRLVAVETGGTKEGEKKFASYCWQNRAPNMGPTFSTLFNPALELYPDHSGMGDRTQQSDQTWYEKDRFNPDRADEFKDRYYYCVKPWMRWVMDNRKKAPTDREKQIVWVTQFIRTMESQLPLDKFLPTVGKDNYFYQVRIAGFRTNDSNGDTEYTSDTLGTFNEKEGAGVFSEFAAKYGITQNELNARYLSEGF